MQNVMQNVMQNEKWGYFTIKNTADIESKNTLMLKYIEETPGEIETYLNSPLDGGSLKLISELSIRRSVVLVGCGTSYHVALLGERYFQVIAGINAHALPSFDFALYRPELVRDKILIAISESGAAKPTREAVDEAKKRNALTAGVTGSAETPIAQVADLHIVVPGGPEKVGPKTRTFATGTVLLLRLAYEVRKLNDASYPNPFPEPAVFRLALEKAYSDSRKTIDKAASDWCDLEMFTFTGSGPAWVAAFEAALKMRENNYTFAEGHETEEYAHGRTRSYAKDRPLIVFALNAPGIERCIDLINNALENKVPVMVVAEEGVSEIPHVDYLIRIPKMPSDNISSIIAAMVMMMFSHQLSLAKKIDPDIIRLDQQEFLTSHRKWIFPPGTH